MENLNPKDIVTSIDSVTSTVWSDNAPTLTHFYTSSVQVAGNSGRFYSSVYQTGSDESNAAVQFDVAYCDEQGSGSVFYNALVTGSSPSRTNYGQYRNLIIGDEYGSFVFGDYTGSYFYAITIDRARYKEKIMLGTMDLSIKKGANVVKLTDNSSIQTTQVFKDAGRKYELVSGSAGTVYTGKNDNGWTTSSGSYGWVLPDVGIILLNGAALDGAVAAGGVLLATGRNSNQNDTGSKKLIDALNTGDVFTLNSEETLSSKYLFIRARNEDYNYTSNPSFISGSTGEILYDSFIYNPKTYVTTVGMYNADQELLAVAKLSRPLLKDFSKEVLLRVKLDF